MPELPRPFGPIVSALLEHDFIVLFPVRPSMVANYLKTFTPSGAKGDPADAEFAVELLLLRPRWTSRLSSRCYGTRTSNNGDEAEV